MHPVVTGMPGLQALASAAHRVIFRDGTMTGYLSGGRVIDGTKSRDPGNTGDITTLRAGLPMGRIASGGKYAPSILGKSATAYVGGATTLNLTVAAATELVRRIGSTGTFKVAGPPAANGDVNVETVTYSAVDTTTGDVTVTALANSYVTDSLIMPTDGSEFPKTFINDGWGLMLANSAGTVVDQPYAHFPVAGIVKSAEIINWPADASTRDWLASMYSVHGEGKYVFDHKF